VMVSVLRAGGSADVVAIARGIDAAVVASPAGSTRATRVTPTWNEQALTHDGATRLVLDGNVVASDVSVTTGTARVRRLADGWLVMRRAPGAFTLSIVTVDSRLRVVRSN